MNEEVKVLDMTHADEVIREVEGGVAPTMQSRMGTGGNQVPLVMDRASGQAVAIGLDRRNQAGVDEVQPALQSSVSDGGSTVAIGVSFDGRKDAPVIPECAHTECVGTNPGFKSGVAIGIDGYNQSVTGDVSKTMTTISSDYHHVPCAATRHIVRRLTPTECERLQAFPDGWTRIPYRGKPADQCPDSPRYKALGNSWATNCAEWILRRIVAAVRLGMI